MQVGGNENPLARMNSNLQVAVLPKVYKVQTKLPPAPDYLELKLPGNLEGAVPKGTFCQR